MNDKYEFLDLGELEDTIQDVSAEEMKKARIAFSKLKKESMNDAKSDECYYCKKKVKGMCNSHTVPAFTLRNIAVNGKIYSINSLVHIPFLKDELGVNESGTFHIICRDCDQKIFQDYEKEEAYNSTPSCKMLSEISLKNTLKAIYKRKLEHQLIGKTPLSVLSNQLYSGALDLREYELLFSKSKKSVEKNLEDSFHIYEYIELNYTVPIAYQGLIALNSDLQGKQINDIYNYDPNYEIKELQIAIFPLKGKSVIILFVEKDNHRYRDFFKQLKKLPTSEKLKIINYIVFAFTEDFFLSPKLDKTVLREIKKVAEQTTFTGVNPLTLDISDLKGSVKDRFNYRLAEDIPNILSEKYKII